MRRSEAQPRTSKHERRCNDIGFNPEFTKLIVRVAITPESETP